MKGNLYPTTIYLSEELKRQIELLALATDRPKAQVVREVMNEGLKKVRPKSKSAQALVNLTGIIKEGLPHDISKKHDQYLWK